MTSRDLRDITSGLSPEQLRVLRDKLPTDSRGLADWIALRREGEDEVSPVEVILLQRAASRAHWASTEPLCGTARHIIDGLPSTLVPRQLALLHESMAKLLPAERKVVRAQLCGVLAGVSATRCTRRSERWAAMYDEKFAAFDVRAPALSVAGPTLEELNERRSTFGTDDIALEQVESVMMQENIDAHRGRMADYYGDKRGSLEINCFLEGNPTLELTAQMLTAVDRAEKAPAIPKGCPRIAKVKGNLRKLRVVLANHSYDDPAYRRRALSERNESDRASGSPSGRARLNRLEALELRRLDKRLEGDEQRGEPETWEAWEEKKSAGRRAEAQGRGGSRGKERRAAEADAKRARTDVRTALWRARKNNFLRASELLSTLNEKRARSTHDALREGEREAWEKVARELACIDRAQEPALQEAERVGLVVERGRGRGSGGGGGAQRDSPVKRAAAASGGGVSGTGAAVKPWSLRNTWLNWMKQNGTLAHVPITEAEFGALTASQQEHLSQKEDERGNFLWTEGCQFVALGYTLPQGSTAGKKPNAKAKKKASSKTSGGAKKGAALSSDNKLKNSVCARVWKAAWTRVATEAQNRKVQTKKGKKEDAEPRVLTDPVELSRYGMQQLRMMSESDAKAVATAKQEEEREKRIDGRNAHLGFVKRKESLRLRIGGGSASVGSKVASAVPRMNFMANSSMVVARPKRAQVPQLEQTLAMAAKLGMTEMHAKNASEFSDAREIQRKLRRARKEAAAPSELAQSRFERWRDRKAANERALRYVASVPKPAVGDPEHTWRDVGQSLKLIDPEGALLAEWIDWTGDYRTRAKCTQAWQRFEPQLCDENFLADDADVTKEAMRSLLLRGHGKHADFVSAFEVAFRESWKHGKKIDGELCKPPTEETMRRWPQPDDWQPSERTAHDAIKAKLASGDARISTKHFNRMLVQMGVELHSEQVSVMVSAVMQPRKKKALSPKQRAARKKRRGKKAGTKTTSGSGGGDFSDESDDDGFDSDASATSPSKPARRDDAFPATKAAGLGGAKATKAPTHVQMDKLVAFVEGSLTKAAQLDQSKQRDALLRLEQLSAAGRARKQIRERRQQGKPPVAPVLARGVVREGGAASKRCEEGGDADAAAAAAASPRAGEGGDDGVVAPSISLKWKPAKGSPPVAFFVLQHGGAEGSAEQKRNEWCTLMMDPDRATDPPTPPTLQCALTELLYNDGTKRPVLPGTTYCFRLRAYNDHGASGWSFISLTTKHAAPRGLTLTARTHNSVSVEWSTEEYQCRLLDAFLARFGDLARHNEVHERRRGGSLLGDGSDPARDPTMGRGAMIASAATAASTASFIRREQLTELFQDGRDQGSKLLANLRAFLAAQPANDGSTSAADARTVLELIKDLASSSVRGADAIELFSQADVIELFRNRFLFKEWGAWAAAKGSGGSRSSSSKGGSGGRRSASSKSDRGRHKKAKDLGNATSPSSESYFVLEKCVDEARDVWVTLYRGITPSITLHNLESGSRLRLRVRVDAEEFFSSADDEKDKSMRKVLAGHASESLVVCLRLNTPLTPLLAGVSAVHVALRWPSASLAVQANVTLAVARQKKAPASHAGSDAVVVRKAGQEIDSRSVFIRNTPALVKSWVGVAALSAAGGGGVNVKENFHRFAGPRGDLARDDLRDLLHALDAPGGNTDSMDYLAYHIAEIELLGGVGPDAASPRAASTLLSAWKWDHDPRSIGDIDWSTFSEWWRAAPHYFVLQRTLPLPALHTKASVGLESFVQNGKKEKMHSRPEKKNPHRRKAATAQTVAGDGVATTRELARLFGPGARRWKSLMEDDAACDEAIESGKTVGRDVTGLPPNTLFGFRMRVVIASTFSCWSAPLYVFTPPRALDRAVVIARGDRWVQLRWFRKDVGIAQYVVEQSSGDAVGPWTPVWKGARTGALKATLVAKITRLTPNTSYHFRVRAVNRGGRLGDASPPTLLETVFTREAQRAVTVPRNALSRGHFDVSCGNDIVMGDTIIFTELCYRREDGGGRGGRGAAAAAMGHRVGNTRVMAEQGLISGPREVFVCERTIAATVEGENYSRSRRNVLGTGEGPTPERDDDRKVLPLDDLFELDEDGLPSDTAPSPARRQLRLQVLWCTTSHQEEGGSGYMLHVGKSIARTVQALQHFEILRKRWHEERERRHFDEDYTALQSIYRRDFLTVSRAEESGPHDGSLDGSTIDYPDAGHRREEDP